MGKWLLQSNPNRFDVITAFRELKQVDWRQNIKAEIGDEVYIYVAAPIKSIKLKCKVIKLNLPKVEIDDSKYVVDKSTFENYGKYMRLEVIEEYNDESLSFEVLSKHGLKTVQGPMKITGELEHFINKITGSKERLEVLDASLNIEFGSIYEAINACVGTDYTGWMKACYPSVSGNDNFRMWFPKLAKVKNGDPVPTANDCVNTISDDWNQLVFEDLKLTSDEEPDYIYKGYDLIFAKEPDGGYVFRGVFVYDEANSDSNRYVAKRIATKVRMIGNPATDIELLDNIGEKRVNSKPFDHNIILYGPPGTGKTYNTMIYAVAIIEGRNLDDVKEEAKNNYAAVKARYEKYRENGQIAFTTFHQSYGYEEFIEGIKPSVEEENENSTLEYVKESGVFKAFCEKAMLPSAETEEDYGLNKSPSVWKVSLGHTYDNPTRTECMENDHIRIGWDEYGEDFSDREGNYSGKAVLNSFYNRMRIGDIVLSCYTASTIDAIGVVTGECEWHPEYGNHKRLRNVRWLVKGINENIVKLNNDAAMTLSTVYKMKIPASAVLELVSKYDDRSKAISGKDENEDKYVFIIDEINRGNISKIFGELITLIESTKRKGADEEASVILPYTGEKFSVPGNVYILGTMNTADRSIALMDTALRRRFSFEEMMPQADVLRVMGADLITDNGQTLDVAKMLEVINERIMYLYDREHTIGHAFFTCLKDDPTIDRLASIFEKAVIPLLQEYFYEDYGKIQLVLGDNGKTGDNKQFQFIRDDKIVIGDVFNGAPEVDIPDTKYSIQKSALRKIESYKLIGKGL